MLSILCNGSCVYPHTTRKGLATLFQRLSSTPLNRVYECYGNFISLVGPSDLLPSDRRDTPQGFTEFRGNFFGVKYPFELLTDEAHLIRKLTKAIRANQERPDYLGQPDPMDGYGTNLVPGIVLRGVTYR